MRISDWSSDVCSSDLLRTDLGSVEGAHRRLGQSEAGCLDYDVIGPVRAREDRPNRWQEVVRHGAADAAVGQFHHVLLVAALDAAALHDLRVDAEIAELVDDERDPPPAGIAQQVADGAGLAGPEEAGDRKGVV